MTLEERDKLLVGLFHIYRKEVALLFPEETRFTIIARSPVEGQGGAFVSDDEDTDKLLAFVEKSRAHRPPPSGKMS